MYQRLLEQDAGGGRCRYLRPPPDRAGAPRAGARRDRRLAGRSPPRAGDRAAGRRGGQPGGARAAGRALGVPRRASSSSRGHAAPRQARARRGSRARRGRRPARAARGLADPRRRPLRQWARRRSRSRPSAGSGTAGAARPDDGCPARRSSATARVAGGGRRDPHPRGARRAGDRRRGGVRRRAGRAARAAARDGDALLADLEAAIKGLAATRPTAVNLFWALDRMRRLREARRRGCRSRALRARLLDEAEAIRRRGRGRQPRDGRARRGARAGRARASSPTATPARWPRPATGRRSA